MTILLTGASGFVGAALLRRLQGDDCDVMALVRAPTTRLAGVVPTVCVGEIAGTTDFAAVLAGITSRPCKIHFSKTQSERDKGKPRAPTHGIDVDRGVSGLVDSKASPIRRSKQAQQKALQAKTHHRPHQPAQVVPGGAGFEELSLIWGQPPKVIWLKTRNQPRAITFNILLENRAMIEKARLNHGQACVEVSGV